VNFFTSTAYVMLKINIAGLLLGIAFSAQAQTSDLLITEYVEGSSNNKYLELFNGTGSPIDLGAQNYRVEVYANGSNTPTSLIPLTGVVAPGGVYVIAHPNATAWSGTPDLLSFGLNYNGDDAVALRKGNNLVDLVGNIGCQPDLQWGTGDLSTADNTIRRKPTACIGVTVDPHNQNCPFPTLELEWDGFPMDEVSGLGFHVSSCTPVPLVSFALPASALLEGNSGTTPHPVAVTMDVPPQSNVTVLVSDVGTGTATPGVDYTFAPATLTFTPTQSYPATQTAILNVIGDTQAEPDETVQLSLSVTGGAATLGLNAHTATILNDDAPSTLYSQQSGSWSAPNLWNSLPDGSGIFVTDPNNTQGPTGPVYHCIIQTGHHLTLPNTKGITTLTVQSGGSIKANTTINRYLEIYGDAVIVNGVMGAGNANDGISLEFHAVTATISGIGTIDLSRIRKNGFNATHLTIARSLNLRYPNSAALYSDLAGYPFNTTINPGVAVTVTRGDISIDGVNGTNNSARWGTLTVLGMLDIQLGHLWLRTDNPNTPAQDIHYVVGPGGTIKVGGKIYGNQGVGGNAKARLTLQAGAQLVLSGSGEVMQGIDPARDPVDCQANSLVDYAGVGPQDIEDEIVYASLRAGGGGLKTLEGPTSVNGTLILAGGLVQLGAHDLVIGPAGQAVGGSSGAYVRTNGAGMLRLTVGATTRLFPIGDAGYNLLTLTNTGTADVFGARVEDEAPAPGNVVGRVWHVEEAAPGGSNATLTLQWNAAEEMPGFTRSACYISRYTPSGWTADAPGAATGANPYTRQRAGLSEFGAFAVGSNMALPVTWLDFRGRREGEDALLDWSTASEVDNLGFEIQRSADAKEWEPIAFVPGAGTSGEVNAYVYWDIGVGRREESRFYYRLKQVDYDGGYEFSPIRHVEFPPVAAAWRVYPNPASHVLHVDLPPGATRARILDLAGREVRGHDLGPGETTLAIPVWRMPAGQYWLELWVKGKAERRSVAVYY
jgi:hypothetical protein